MYSYIQIIEVQFRNRKARNGYLNAVYASDSPIRKTSVRYGGVSPVSRVGLETRTLVKYARAAPACCANRRERLNRSRVLECYGLQESETALIQSPVAGTIPPSPRSWIVQVTEASDSAAAIRSRRCRYPATSSSCAPAANNSRAVSSPTISSLETLCARQMPCLGDPPFN